MKVAIQVLISVVVTAMTIWAVGALYYAPLVPENWRLLGAVSYAVITIAAFLLLPRRVRTLFGFTLLFALLVVMYFQIAASNERDWQPEVAVTPNAEITGDLVTIHGVGNFDYRTETDFTPRWETRTYDLRKLDSADVIASYWAGKAIAHVMLSFGFEGKEYLAVAI